MNTDSSHLLARSTTLGIGLLISTVFLGTGSSLAPVNIKHDRGGYSHAAVTTNNSWNFNSDFKDDIGKGLDFQKLSLDVMSTYGFSVKQYSEIMQVTRATVYKWHDLNAPLKKIQSKNVDRLNRLNKALFGIKEKRKNRFAAWLRNPLDEDAIVVNALLINKTLNIDSIMEVIRSINIGLYASESSNELDDLLGLS